MALTDANPAFGPTEQWIMLEMSDLLIDSERFGSPRTQLKNEFLTVLNRALSALFFKNLGRFFEKSELRELKIRDFEGSKNGPETS